MSEKVRPSDEQLAEWVKYHTYWSLDDDARDQFDEDTGYESTSYDSFPAYYADEYHPYLRGLIAEVLEYRAFKRGEWAGVEQ